MRQKICRNDWVIYSMSPTLARAHYSCPNNAIGLVSTGQAVEGSLAEFFLLLPMFMSIKRYAHSTFLINWILIQIETQWTSKLPSKMPIFVEKYAICALCWNMQKNEATCEICSNRVICVKLACLDKSAVLVCFSIDHFDTVQVYHMIFITDMVSDFRFIADACCPCLSALIWSLYQAVSAIDIRNLMKTSDWRLKRCR